MIVATNVKVKTGVLEMEVPNPNPQSAIEMPVQRRGIPVVGFDFALTDPASVIDIVIPRETAEQLHRILGDALQGRSSIETFSHVPLV